MNRFLGKFAVDKDGSSPWDTELALGLDKQPHQDSFIFSCVKTFPHIFSHYFPRIFSALGILAHPPFSN